MDKPVSDAAINAIVGGHNNAGEAESYIHCVDEICQKVEQIERKMNEIEQGNIRTGRKQIKASKDSSSLNDKYNDKHVPGIRKHLREIARKEAAAAKRMNDLMRQFGTILNQITRHKLSWPFMQPVDVEGLGLDDYYQVIDKPMDLSTIQKQMDARDGTGYKNVRQICDDVMLVFENAMKYNEEKSEIHGMAKTLLKRFEEMWQRFLPRVREEEKRREVEVKEEKLLEQLAHEAECAKLAGDVSDELNEIDERLDDLREMVVLKCRKFSVEEKRRLGAALARMSPENLSRALEIVAQADPTFQPAADVVNLDIDAQSESTLWRLKFFVNATSEDQGNGSGEDGDKNGGTEFLCIDMNPNNKDNSNNNNYKQKREIPYALAKASRKKRRKPDS